MNYNLLIERCREESTNKEGQQENGGKDGR